MVFITSAAYVDTELISELGNLPPAFLPVGNKRLFQYQRDLFPSEEKIFLSIPESYQISNCDALLLKNSGIDIITVPDKLSLGNSILYCLNITGSHNQPVKILYGDTLIYNIDCSKTDVFSVGDTNANYNWHFVNIAEKKYVLSGYLSFSNSSEMIKSITRKEGNFLKAIDDYSENYKPLIPEKKSPWLDFGHIQTYYRSKSYITTQRAFNEMAISPKTVVKSSYKKNKIKAEAEWFTSLPSELKFYTPQFLGERENNGNCGYEIEYLYLSTLSELYVFGQLPAFSWEKIFQACDDFLSDCANHKVTQPTDMSDLYYNKTIQRLSKTEIDLNTEWVINGKKTPNIHRILEDVDAILKQSSSLNELALCHGDFCFSNILYNFRTQSIKVIDPRGVDFTNKKSVYGDTRYDIAKLAHSVSGGYDHIVCNYYKYQQSGENNLELQLFFGDNHFKIQQVFNSMLFTGKSAKSSDIYALLVHLFLSMLPLHSDAPCRQKALFANALKIYAEEF